MEPARRRLRSYRKSTSEAGRRVPGKGDPRDATGQAGPHVAHRQRDGLRGERVHHAAGARDGHLRPARLGGRGACRRRVPVRLLALPHVALSVRRPQPPARVRRRRPPRAGARVRVLHAVERDRDGRQRRPRHPHATRARPGRRPGARPAQAGLGGGQSGAAAGQPVAAVPRTSPAAKPAAPSPGCAARAAWWRRFGTCRRCSATSAAP